VKSALAGPSEENFRNFIITGKSIIVYLNGGVDLSGAAAQIEIPFEKLSKVIDPNCPYVN
jgi:hypothetical protein